MIVLGKVYRFCADEIAALEASASGVSSSPFRLTVFLRSGQQLSVIYADKKARDDAMVDLSRQIDREKRQDSEKILNTLYLLQNSMNRVDKRQLRIWRQLKALLGIKEELEE